MIFDKQFPDFTLACRARNLKKLLARLKSYWPRASGPALSANTDYSCMSMQPSTHEIELALLYKLEGQ